VIIKLTESEILLACNAASQRFASAAALGRKRNHGGYAFSLDDHVCGCLGELAVAKQYNRFWSGTVGEIRAKDVGTLQVRATYRLNGCLILHQEDADEDPFFFVVVMGGGAACDLKGWIIGREGKDKARYWRDVDPAHGIVHAAYFVPAGDLKAPPEQRAKLAAVDCHA
jgi:hypothetical protein